MLQIRKSKLIILGLAIATGLVFTYFRLQATRVPEDYAQSLRKFESSVAQINPGNFIGSLERNVYHSGKSGTDRCNVISSTIQNISTTQKKCSVYYTRYFGTNDTDLKQFLEKLNSSIVSLGWQDRNTFDTTEESIAGMLSPDHNGTLDYKKDTYEISVRLMSGTLPDSCSYDIDCQFIKKHLSPTFRNYITVSGEFTKAY